MSMFSKKASPHSRVADVRPEPQRGFADIQSSLQQADVPAQPQVSAAGSASIPVDDGIVSIGRGTVIVGEINECRTLEIQGRVEGTISTDVLVIHEGGSVKGRVHTSNAVVFGEFNGQLEVSGLLDIRGTGRVEGELAYGQLAVAMGGHISGSVFTGMERDTRAPQAAAHVAPAPTLLTPAHPSHPPHPLPDQHFRPNLTVLNGQSPVN